MATLSITGVQESHSPSVGSPPETSSGLVGLIKNIFNALVKFFEEQKKQRNLKNERERSFRQVINSPHAEDEVLLKIEDEALLRISTIKATDLTDLDRAQLANAKSKILKKLGEKLKTGYVFENTPSDQSSLPTELNHQAQKIHSSTRMLRRWEKWDGSSETGISRGRRFEEECFLNLKLDWKLSHVEGLPSTPSIFIDEWINLEIIGLDNQTFLPITEKDRIYKWKRFLDHEEVAKLMYPISAIQYSFYPHPGLSTSRMCLNYFLNSSYEEYHDFRDAFKENPTQAIQKLRAKVVGPGQPFYFYFKYASKNTDWTDAFNVVEILLGKAMKSSFAIPLYKKVVKKFEGNETAALRYFSRSFQTMHQPSTLATEVQDALLPPDILKIVELFGEEGESSCFRVGEAVHPIIQVPMDIGR